MNRKAETDVSSDLLTKEVIFIILTLGFIVGMFFVIDSKTDGASTLEEYYSKEISRMINSASPGDIIEIQVHDATEIAQKNEIDFNEIFNFHNSENEICVRLTRARQTCYYYFNDISIPNSEIKFGLGENDGNTLVFQVAEKSNE